MKMTSKAPSTDNNPHDDSHGKRPYLNRSAQSMSIDSLDGSYVQREHYQKFVPTLPPSPHGHHMLPYGRPYHLSHYSRIPPQRNLHSVITTSFSIEEEREHGMIAARGSLREQRMEAEDLRQDADDRDDWGSPRSGKRMYYNRASPTFTRHAPRVSPMSRDLCSPHGHHRSVAMSPRGPAGHYPPYVQRSFSSGYFGPPMELKRSYYHHSRPISHYPGQLPPDFLPPKRPKLDSNHGNRKELVISPSSGSDKGVGNWGNRPKEVHRSSSFPAPSGWNNKHIQSMPSPSMMYQGSRHHPYPQVSPAGEEEETVPSWHSSNQWGQMPPEQNTPRFWDSPRDRQMSESERAWGSPPREVIGYRRETESHRRVSFESGGFKQESDTERQPTSESKEKMEVDEQHSNRKTETHGEKVTMKETSDGPIMLLSLPQDRVALSETLCVVRDNIEVFTATLSDVNAPAPGRKHAVVVGQVGLRCIHCRHTTRSCDRVKRAVCYPSSIKRIYRAVIDMKLDHFSQCRYVPTSLKNKLDELKAIHTRSTGTTMSYFCNAAKLLGMEDAANGVVFRENVSFPPRPVNPVNKPVEEPKAPTSLESEPPQDIRVSRTNSSSSSSLGSQEGEQDPPQRTDSMSTDSLESSSRSVTVPSTVTLEHSFEGLVPLALHEDKTALSPLRCFLREQVCAFSATEKDIAVRAPTTFSIAVGQVGIGCIHCVKQAATLRSNRAVCFPFSIARIYQSVADIQRFHFGECKNMPKVVKDHFLELQSASSKGSKGLATRQYWVTSAKKIGLVDTAQGIRFGRDPTKPENSKSFSLDMLAQVAFSVTTASKQLVHPSDKSCIAEFLYIVMEQLQPCRFTEADRNKRRLKDVGCIGVECKHCAGQVDSRKFFWSSVSAVESNFVSVHTHMLECRMVPQSLKDHLIELKRLRKEQTAALKTGSQKAFFARVWDRLHEDECSDSQATSESQCEPSKENSNETSESITEKLADLSTGPPLADETENEAKPESKNESDSNLVEKHLAEEPIVQGAASNAVEGDETHLQTEDDQGESIHSAGDAPNTVPQIVSV